MCLRIRLSRHISVTPNVLHRKSVKHCIPLVSYNIPVALFKFKFKNSKFEVEDPSQYKLAVPECRKEKNCAAEEAKQERLVHRQTVTEMTAARMGMGKDSATEHHNNHHHRQSVTAE